MNDWYVIRFTGRQIYKNTEKCLRQLIDYIKHLENKYNQKRIILHENHSELVELDSSRHKTTFS